MKEDSKLITISGYVTEAPTQQGLEGLLVEIWDKNIFKDDLLGHTLTDKSGAFSIEINIERSHRKLFDTKPDIYFIIYQGNKCLKNTSSEAVINLGENRAFSLSVNLNKPDAVKKDKNIYLIGNEKTRIECVDEIDKNLNIQLNTFFRNAGNSQTSNEYIRPLLEEKGSQLIIAVRDRPWPPHGINGLTIIAACLIHNIGDNNVGVSPIFTLPDESTNIGLITAVFKETIDYLITQKTQTLKYMVREGTIMGPVILSKFGFFPNENEVYLLEDGSRYSSYSISPEKLSQALKYDKYETSDLLEYNVDKIFVEENALYHNFISIPTIDELIKRKIFDFRIIDTGSVFYPDPTGPPQVRS